MAAVLSPCGQYRYRLERNISLYGVTAAVVMVNPSTADADRDDATIRRIIGFGKRFGWSRVIVGNVFAYRAKDICALAYASDPVGPENREHLAAIMSDADVTVVAWGPLSKLPATHRNEWRSVLALAEELGISLLSLGVANDGHPRHPLMLSYRAGLVDWRPPLG